MAVRHLLTGRSMTRTSDFLRSVLRLCREARPLSTGKWRQAAVASLCLTVPLALTGCVSTAKVGLDDLQYADGEAPIEHFKSQSTAIEHPAIDNVTTEEERMLAQAIAKSRTDQRREPLTVIPFGPTFYPTIEDFSGDPLDYLETIRHEAEKYGEFVVRNSNARFVF